MFESIFESLGVSLPMHHLGVHLSHLTHAPAPEQAESHPATRAKTKPTPQPPASTPERIITHTGCAESREEFKAGTWQSELCPSQRGA